MLTQTLQKPQEFTDKVIHPPVEATILVEAEEVGEETQSAPAVEMVTYTPVPIRRDEDMFLAVDALLVRIARPILRFYDWISGPPMTERDRPNLYLESTAISRRIGPFS